MERAKEKKRSTLKYISLLFVSSFILPLIFQIIIYNKVKYNFLLFQIFAYASIFSCFAIFCRDEIINLIKCSYIVIKNKSYIRNILLLFLFGSFSTIVIQSIVYLLNMNLLHIRDVNSKDSFENLIKNLIKSNNMQNIIILLTIVFFSGIVGPVIEEIIFRGLILQSLRQKMDSKIAIVIGSLIFGLWHINLYTALCAFLFGIILSIFYIRYNSIFVPIVIHIGANIFALINIMLLSVIK